MDKEKVNTEYSPQEKEIIREFKLAEKRVSSEQHRGYKAEIIITIYPDGKHYIETKYRRAF